MDSGGGWKVTRYFVDSEFIDDGLTIGLISIGLVCEDGRELYLQSCEFNPQKANQWVKDNVLPYLSLCPCECSTPREGDNIAKFMQRELRVHDKGQCVDQQRGRIHNCPWRNRSQMAREVASFLDPSVYGKPELVSWCGAYDFVALCQLFGTMMDIPSDWPHYMRDIQMLLDERGISDDELPQV